jgi:hypothetical protein
MSQHAAGRSLLAEVSPRLRNASKSLLWTAQDALEDLRDILWRPADSWRPTRAMRAAGIELETFRTRGKAAWERAQARLLPPDRPAVLDKDCTRALGPSEPVPCLAEIVPAQREPEEDWADITSVDLPVIRGGRFVTGAPRRPWRKRR